LESTGVPPDTEDQAERRRGERRRERREVDRREGERRAGPRRAEDRGRYRLQAILWAICGALVVLYLFFVAVGGVNPTKGVGWSIAALVLAVLYVGHAWRRLWGGGFTSRPDRERRGF
jgi:hypothetical protein